MSRQEIDQGIPHNPPDLRVLDCSGISKEINNLLVRRQVITIRDINENNNLLSNTILKVILPKIIQLYKEQDSLKVKEKQHE